MILGTMPSRLSIFIDCRGTLVSFYFFAFMHVLAGLSRYVWNCLMLGMMYTILLHLLCLLTLVYFQYQGHLMIMSIKPLTVSCL